MTVLAALAFATAYRNEFFHQRGDETVRYRFRRHLTASLSHW